MKKSSILRSQRVCDRAEETGKGSQLERISALVPPGPSTCLSALVYHRLATFQALENEHKMVPAHRKCPIYRKSEAA